jgi:hypothetical protein
MNFTHNSDEAHDFVTISDDTAVEAMRLLARGE